MKPHFCYGTMFFAMITILSGCSSTKKLTLKESVAGPIQEHMGEFRNCYKKGSKEAVDGNVTTEFVVGTQGRVTQAKIKKTTLNNPDVENCILATIKTIQFTPLPDGKPFIVSYPFHFKYN